MSVSYTHLLVYKDVEYKGSFSSSDPLINRIWDVGAYTVHLNMQEYIWDGIKRDRLVWVGDMHPETTTIQALSLIHILWIINSMRRRSWMGLPRYSG